MKDLEFEAPAPGSWMLETLHFSRPLSVYGGERFFDALIEGMRQSNAHYGAPLEYLDFQAVNRHIYLQPRPVGAPPGAAGLPPKWLFTLIQHLHPAVRKRRKRAQKVVAEKLWRADIELWDNQIKPAVLARAAEIRAIKPADLDDEALITHLIECDEFVTRTVINHHRFNNTFGVPLGDFLSQSMEWTGLGAGELLRLFEGYSEISRGALGELNALRDALKSDPDMVDLVGSETAPEKILETLQAHTGPVSDTVNAYIDTAGYCMLTGYDVADHMTIESPETMVRIIRSALNGGARTGELAGDAVTAEIRATVPDAHKAEFDDLLIEARLAYRMRDERGGNGDSMSVALSRRALLEVGRRLAEQGKVKDATDIPDATQDEIIGLLRGGTSPNADEIHARAQYRRTRTSDDAPPFLGPKPSPPPPVEWFPKSSRRLQRGFGVMFGLMFEGGHEASEDTVVRGLGVYPGIYEGPVRLIDGIEDIEKVQEGDVIVASTTAPSINVILPLIGALVTDRGGLLSHAAIVAREFGLPAVVGCDDATERLSNGVRVRVDGEKGEVCILD